jgi:hypothetical protein
MVRKLSTVFGKPHWYQFWIGLGQFNPLTYILPDSFLNYLMAFSLILEISFDSMYKFFLIYSELASNLSFGSDL